MQSQMSFGGNYNNTKVDLIPDDKLNASKESKSKRGKDQRANTAIG